VGTGGEIPAWGYLAGGRRHYGGEESGSLSQKTSESYSGEGATKIQLLDASGNPVDRAQTGESETETSSVSVTIPLGPQIVESRSHTTSWSRTTTRGFFGSVTVSETTVGESHAVSRGMTTSRGWSLSETEGEAHARSRSVSMGISEGVVEGESYGKALSVQRGIGRALTEGYARSRSVSLGVTEGVAWGAGLVPSLGIHVSRIGVDEAKRLVYTLLENLKRRVDNMLQMGGFHALAVLLAPDAETRERAKALFLGTLSVSSPFTPYPLRVLDADEELVANVRALVFDLRRKPNAYVGDTLMYVTLLTAVEAAALTMPLRVEAPGLTSVVENIPEFRLPDGSRYDIELGYVISHETGETD